MRASKNTKTGRFQLRFRDSSGKHQQFSSKKDFPSSLKQHEADAIATEIHRIHEQTIDGMFRPLLADCVERMLKHLEHNNLKGIKVYRAHAKNALLWDKNNTIDDVVRVCNQMRDDMLAMKKSNGQPRYSNNTICKSMYIYKRTANLAFEQWGFLEHHIGKRMKPPAIPKARERHLTTSECAILLNSCSDEQTRCILELYALTGIRHAELRRLSSNNLIKHRIIIDGKNGTTRSFAISEQALVALSTIHFPLERTYDQLKNEFNKAKKLAGITDLKMHDLRHTFASWLAQSGDVSLHELREVLGHNDINMTLRYAHLNPQHLDHVASTLTIKTQLKAV